MPGLPEVLSIHSPNLHQLGEQKELTSQKQSQERNLKSPVYPCPSLPTTKLRIYSEALGDISTIPLVQRVFS